MTENPEKPEMAEFAQKWLIYVGGWSVLCFKWPLGIIDT